MDEMLKERKTFTQTDAVDLMLALIFLVNMIKEFNVGYLLGFPLATISLTMVRKECFSRVSCGCW